MRLQPKVLSSMSDSAQPWADSALRSLDAAELLHGGGLWPQACFHAQQAAELPLKAVIVRTNVAPPRVHGLMELCTHVSPEQQESIRHLDISRAVVDRPRDDRDTRGLCTVYRSPLGRNPPKPHRHQRAGPRNRVGGRVIGNYERDSVRTRTSGEYEGGCALRQQVYSVSIGGCSVTARGRRRN